MTYDPYSTLMRERLHVPEEYQQRHNPWAELIGALDQALRDNDNAKRAARSNA